ncbi:hypothetical protein BJF83_02820 [Nocardiopsis sp. CNR-923]|nr:hypothetical protein BJF83_02820 [Nocardiopsis sp. CNR-923]
MERATGSSSRAAVRARGTGHQRWGRASIMRSSHQPRGRTGGKSVLRWNSRSARVAARGPRPPSHSAKVIPGSGAHRPSPSGVSGIAITRAASAYWPQAVAGSARWAPSRTGRVREESVAAQMTHLVDFHPVGRPRQWAELANTATSGGPRRCASSQRARRSAVSEPVSRQTWTEAVLHIMVRPLGWR